MIGEYLGVSYYLDILAKFGGLWWIAYILRNICLFFFKPKIKVLSPRFTLGKNGDSVSFILMNNTSDPIHILKVTYIPNNRYEMEIGTWETPLELSPSTTTIVKREYTRLRLGSCNIMTTDVFSHQNLFYFLLRIETAQGTIFAKYKMRTHQKLDYEKIKEKANRAIITVETYTMDGRMLSSEEADRYYANIMKSPETKAWLQEYGKRQTQSGSEPPKT